MPLTVAQITQEVAEEGLAGRQGKLYTAEDVAILQTGTAAQLIQNIPHALSLAG